MPTIATIIKEATEPSEFVKVEEEYGKKTYRWFEPAERYCIDFADDYHEFELMQFGSPNDGASFGTWVSPTKLLRLCYCEGDWTLTVYENQTVYNSEMRSLINYYKEPPDIITVILGDGKPVYSDNELKFFANIE